MTAQSASIGSLLIIVMLRFGASFNGSLPCEVGSREGLRAACWVANLHHSPPKSPNSFMSYFLPRQSKWQIPVTRKEGWGAGEIPVISCRRVALWIIQRRLQ